MSNRFKNKVGRVLAKLKVKLIGLSVGKDSFVDRSVDFQNPKNVQIGNQSKLYKQCSVYVGDQGTFKLGNHSHIAPHGYLLVADNSLEIGNDVAIGPYCTLVCHSNGIELSQPIFRKNYVDDDIKIGSNVFIGAHCVILPGSVIEDNVVVASNSVVKGVLKSNKVYGGSPAKEIKEIEFESE